MRYNSKQLIFPEIFMRASPLAWYLLSSMTFHWPTLINQFERVDEAACVDPKCPVIVIETLKTNWDFIDLFPVLWK